MQGVKGVYILFSILLLGLVARCFVAFHYPGSIRPDEIFQYMEPAHKIAFGTWAETWEWRAGIRSWLVPSLIAFLMKGAHALHITDLLLFTKIILAFLSLPLICLFFWAGYLCSGERGAVLSGISAALWPDIINGSIHPLGEYISGNLLVGGVVLSFIEISLRKHKKGLSSTNIVIASFLLSCAFIVRFQFAPAVALASLYILLKINNRNRCFYIGIFLIPLIISGVVDWYTLGYPYQSIVKNYYININMGIANTFGRKGFFFFLKKYFSLWGVMSLPLLYCSFKGIRKNMYPMSIAVFIVLYHTAISHKEISFVYPMIPLLVLSAFLYLSDKIPQNTSSIKVYFVQIAMLVLFLIGNYSADYQYSSEYIKLEQEAAHRKDVCGILFMAPDPQWGQWGGLAGYSVLPVNVPLYVSDDLSGASSFQKSFNYIIAYKGQETLLGAEGITCGDDSNVCLYHVNRSCDGAKDFGQFTRYLESKRE